VAARKVLLYPDPALKAKAKEVGPEDRAAAAQVATDLVDTMRSYGHATGVAATQLGELLRVIAVDVTGHRKTTTTHGLVVLVNPRVVSSEGSEVAREGCLSIPHLTANVRRATKIAVEGLTPEGDPTRLETAGFEARCLLHEIDHLDGVLFLDRVDSLKTDVFRRKSYG